MGAHYKIFMLWNIHLIFFLISGSIYIWTETVIYYMLNRISLICTMYSLHIQNVYTRISATAGSENQKKLKHLFNIDVVYVYIRSSVSTIFALFAFIMN